MGQSIATVDAFTNQPFRGNPAAICVMNAPADEAWMQAVALEMNLSETTYLWPEGDGFRLRWFTPATEVDLCGHATVAAAHLLWEDGIVDAAAPCVFETRSGTLTARLVGDWIEVSFPSQPPETITPPAGLAEALGAEPIEFGENVLRYGQAVFEDESVVRNMDPNYLALSKLPHLGYCVTAQSDGKPYAFVSRFFAPNAGINEDPATGSAHCMLGPYWANKLGRDELVAYQASPRGGDVRIRMDGERAHVAGQAVTVLRGDLV